MCNAFTLKLDQAHMANRILIPTQGPDDWRRFLADPVTQWRRGYSAMAAALSWEAATGLPPEIAALFPEHPELLLSIPEHKVALPGGGRPSQCDVFALIRLGAATCALAVEAKVNETFGPTLADWQATPSPGKALRLDSICQMLGLSDPAPDLRYQLFHRTAAAVVEARRFKTDRAAMVVQSFSQDHRWHDDFARFAAQFGLDIPPGSMGTVSLPCGLPLTLGWATGGAEFL